MDILASMLTYLGCATGIVGALLVSFAVFFSTPNQPANIKHTVAVTTKANALKIATSPMAKPTANLEQRAPVESTAAQSAAAPETATAAAPAPAPQTTVAQSARQRAQASRAQSLRRLVQEERAKRWAYQQDPDFRARFLGYAD